MAGLRPSRAGFHRRETDGFRRRLMDEIHLLPGDGIYGQPIDGLSFCRAIGRIDVLFP